jgi:phosphohistidine phosphatase SixA
MPENKTLIIIRHAHRNKPKGREADNGLSAKGKKQARALSKFYTKLFKSEKARIYSSPKTRCIETVEPLAKKLKIEVEILDSLNEALNPKNAERELSEKARSFHLLWCESKNPLTVICSHGDWIPVYVKQCTGAEIDLDKGGWVQIEMIDDQPRLRWIVQNPDI